MWCERDNEEKVILILQLPFPYLSPPLPHLLTKISIASTMAATLSLLKAPILPPHRLPHSQSKLLCTCKSQNPSPLDTDSSSIPQLQLFHRLKSASLPLTALTLPFLLAPEVRISDSELDCHVFVFMRLLMEA